MIFNQDYAIPIKFISSRFGGTRVVSAYMLAGKILGYRNLYQQFYDRESAYLDIIGDVGNHEYFVDGAKNLVRASLFAAENDDVQIVHLIRHPYSVLHSGETRHEVPGRSVHMHLKNWVFYNLKAKALCDKYPDRSATIQFNDFVSTPKATLSTLAAQLNWGELDIDTDKLDPTKTHLTGNRSRHEAYAIRPKQLTPSAEDLVDLGVTPAELETLIRTTNELGIPAQP